MASTAATGQPATAAGEPAPAPAAPTAAAAQPATAPNEAATAPPASTAAAQPATAPSEAATAPAAPTAAAQASTLSLDAEADGVTVSGAVPDNQARDSILDALKSAFGGDAVKGDITVDPSRSAAPWLAKLRDALAALKIPGLHAMFDGDAVTIGGAIPDRQQVVAALKSVFGDGVRVGALADSVGDWATAANAKATEALSHLNSGFTAADVVSALNLSIVNFSTDSFEVPAALTGVLQNAANDLKGLPAGYEIEVAGYTDSTGDAERNRALSQKRAEAVRDALVKAGAPSDMLTAKGYGAANPVAANDTDEGRFRNRRIEYHIVKSPS
jgi:OOP family OmpA-OmpF porin